jgi:cold-inducible RNA-binding protein
MANKTLYVGNLPYSANEEQLTAHFSTYGASNARIIEGRGFGFVDIDASMLESAIADKHNSQMDGRTLTVNEATPRENRSSGGGGGGGGGGYSRGNSKPRSGNRW